MANLSEEERLKKAQEELEASKKPTSISSTSYRGMLETLGKDEGYDYISDFDKIKKSLLASSYSPYTNKSYSLEEKEALTEEDYFNDLMNAADHTDPNKKTGDLQAFVWGANEAIGGTALYKAIKGEEAVQNKLNQIERVYGNNEFARGLGNVTGKTASLILGGLLGGPIGAAATSGLTSAGQTYTYTDNPIDISVSGITSGLSTLAFMGIADKLKSFFPILGSTGANFAKNAGIGGVAGYATSVLGELGTNVGKVIKGEEVTGEDWLKSFYGMDNLASAGISALTYGTLGTIADKQQAQLNLQTAKNDYREGLNALDRGDKALYNAYSKGDTASAQEIYNQGNQILNLLENTKYDGVKVDTSKVIDPLRQMWEQKNTMYQNLFRGKLGDGSQVSSGLAVANPTVPSTSAASAINPSVISSAVTQSANTPASVANATIPNTNTQTSQTSIVPNTNVAYNNNQPIKGGNNDGGQLQENNTTGVVEARQDTTNQLSDESLDEIYQRIKANYEDTRTAGEEAKKYIITDLTEEEKALLKELSDEYGTPVYYSDLKDIGGESHAGFTTQDGIYIDKDEANNYGLQNIAWHEMAEDLLLNHTDIAGKDITNLVKTLKDTDKQNHVATRLMDNLFKETNMSNAEKRKFIENVELYTKELLFNAYSADKQLGKNNPYREIMGDELYNKTITTLDNLHNAAKGKPKAHLESLIGADTQNQGSGIPQFAARKKNVPTNPNRNLTIEKQNKDIKKLENANDSLRNELTKKEDEVKATEMWSKRTERGKLNKKLDTAKNKLEQTKFEGKEKLKATKEEGKEKLKKLTSKKNEEKAQAVKEVKAKSSDNVRKLKAKNKEDIREAKSTARATTTDKKLRLSLNRLDKALNNVYDKPRSAETEKALDTVRKQTRGTIKLIDKVKTKLPSRYSFFTDDVLDIIDSYYTGGNTMTDEKRASLIKKSKAIEKFAKDHPEYPISKKALDLLKEPSKKNIADLNEKDLISLAEDLQEIGTAVRDMFSFARASEDAMKLRSEALEFAKDRLERGEGRNYNKLKSNVVQNKITEFGENYVDKRSTIETLTTALSGGDPDSPFNFIPDQLKQGYDRYNRAMEKQLKLFDKYVEIKKLGNVRYYNNKLNEIFDPKKKVDVKLKTTNGETYSPTIRDAISVVLGAKDPQFAGHSIGVVTDKFKNGIPLLSEGGNVVFSNNVDERFGKIEKGLKRGVKVKLGAEDIKALEKDLEKYPIVKDLMKTFKELTDLTYELTNEPYEAINGMSLEKRDYYFPIANDPATRQRQNLSDKLKGFNGLDASTTLQNTSMVKPVVEGANGQILIYPIDNVINKLISNAALYNGYSTALYDINSFLSARTDDGETLIELINHLDPSYLTNYGKITNALVGNSKRGGTPERWQIYGKHTKGKLLACTKTSRLILHSSTFLQPRNTFTVSRTIQSWENGTDNKRLLQRPRHRHFKARKL